MYFFETKSDRLQLFKQSGFFLWIVAGLVIFTVSALSQALYQGPASGSVSGGAIVSTDQFAKQPDVPLQPNRKLIMNPFWDKLNPPYIEDRFNATPPAAPAGANLFLDAAVQSHMSANMANAPKVVTDFSGNPETNSIPPDPIMAVGPNHVMTLVNSSFRIYDKKGNLLFQRSADAWFQNVMPYSGAFDPIVIYDNIDNRWVMCWDLQSDNDQTGYWLVSVSDDDNPMGTWCNYAFPSHLNGTTNAFNWGDYQKVGYDHQAIYISGRQFSFVGGNFYCKLRIIPKSELYDPACPAVNYTDFWDFREPNNLNAVVDGPPIVASHLEPPNNNVAYMVVDAPYNTSTFITLWKINDPLGVNGATTLTAVNIPTTAAPQPPDANQLGGGTPRINSGRRVYRNAVYTNGKLWTSTAIGGGTGNQYAFARYVAIDVNNETLLEDVALGSDGFYYIYPAVMVDEDENIVMAFTRSGDTEYAGAAFTGRRAFDPPGLAPSVLLKPGEANYVKTFGGTRNRWGDYMGIGLDPVNTSVIWALVEYAAFPANTWATHVGAFSLKYAISGVVNAQATGDPVVDAIVKVEESGAVQGTDSTGFFEFGAPGDSVTLTISKFEYQTITKKFGLQAYFNLPVNIDLPPAIQATFAGQVKDANTLEGIPAVIEFYAKNDPQPGPYRTVTTDSAGNYSLTTVLDEYELRIYPDAPYPYTVLSGIQLDTTGTALDIPLDPADIMIVDDDDGSTYENYYIAAVESDSLTYHHWDVQKKGAPTAQTMALFPRGIVIWFTGDSDGNAISEVEAQEILTYLNNAGDILISGQDVVEELSGTALMNQLGISFVDNSNSSVVRGESGSAIGDGLVLITGAGAAGNQTSRDIIAIDDSTYTQREFYYAIGSATAGVSYVNGNSKAVLLGFGLEAVTVDERRNAVVQRAIDLFELPVGIAEDDPTLPEAFALHPNFPNPFNPSTTIRFDLPQQSKVTLAVYNMLGQKVRTITNTLYPAGRHQVVWDGTDQSGNPVASGVYIYRISTNNGFSKAQKMMLLK